MKRNVFIIIIATFILFFSLLYSFSLPTNAQTASPSPASTPPPACQNHGGVDCSIVDDQALTHCNDGTIDSASIIYGVTECQAAIKAASDQQSDFMIKTGCYPPSEMTCINDRSYQNLYSELGYRGVANSELGRGDLTQCRKDISDYQAKEVDYKQCLIKNNNPQFTPPSRLALPILKAIFCPIIYGGNSTYDTTADLCVCDNGYFMSEGKCTEATSICRSLHGADYHAKNGTCYKKLTATSTPTPTPKKTPIISPKINSIPTSTPTISPPTATMIFIPPETPTPATQEGAPESESSFITRVFAAIMSRLKNILNLF